MHPIPQLWGLAASNATIAWRLLLSIRLVAQNVTKATADRFLAALPPQDQSEVKSCK
ncbi:hypothetical protein [Microcoleus sp. bin38.metabat.b11b12b14.051]|uniref:hypothetical protein n=1 Tax=Microcoleus sp. bin38.metabat.b11b12b14.051 TaxID=2742709 RepID=UPI0025F66B6D|nr:hypothetical protein [Microcoleus sp. bin38.metabat.b11b12b14.051]